MKTFYLFFLATSLVVSSHKPSQESPELQEATRLTESVLKLFNEDKFDEALPLAKRALQIREKLLPPNDPRVATSLSYLGDVYIAKRDYKAAREIVARLLQVQEVRFGPNDVNLASTLDRLALLHFRAGNSREAEAAYSRALALREKSFGANSPQVAQTLHALGEFYRSKHDFDRAASNYRRALLIFGESSDSTSADYERTSDAFACLAYDHKKPGVFKEIEATRRRFAREEGVGDSHEILNGRALTMPQPVYPDEARGRRLQGIVVVKVEIDETGRVINAIDMCQGPPYLSEASVAAAWRARFTPTKLKGRPVKVKGVIQYRFGRF